MGILQTLGLAPNAAMVERSRAVGFGSPWTETTLTQQTIAAVTGLTVGGPVTREQAMKVPAVAKARAIICGTLAHQPLNVYDGDQPIGDLPAWVQGTNTELPLWHRTAWTLDDLLFTGWSLWLKQYAGNELIAAMRCPRDLWRLDNTGNIEVLESGKWVTPAANDVILFAGPQEGLLDIAAETIRGARAIEVTIADRAITPHAEIELKVTDDTHREADEIDDLIEDYLASRRKVGSLSVGYTPPGFDVLHHGGEPSNMLIEARNAYRLDIANFCNLPAALLDASLTTASLTYSTQEGKRNELIDYSLGFWADPIASRLSQDDVVPAGQRVRFDLTEFVALNYTPGTPTTED